MKLSQKLIEKFELAEFYNNFPAVIFNLKISSDFTQECTFISENSLKILGFSVNELINNWQIFLDRVSDHDKLLFKEKYLVAKETTNRLEFKGKFKTKNNTVIWIKLSSNLLHKHDYFELQGIITDITEEKFAELKEEKYRNALIHISRHPIIFQGDLNNIGEFSTRLVSETLDVSRVSFWLYDEVQNSIFCDKLYISKSNKVESGTFLNATDFPEYFDAILNKPYIVADNAREHLDTKCFNEAYFIPNNIYSLLDVPVFHNGKLLGVICLEETESIRQWQKTEINFLFQFGEYIAYCFAVSEKNLFEEEMEYLNKNLTILVEEKTKELSRKTLEIELKNKDILDSIQYAKKIQATILPDRDELEVVFSDFFVHYKPKDIVAGDFYWVHRTQNKILFAVCDCTGHGIPGAFVSIMAYKILRRAVNEFKLTEPKEILEKVNNIFNEHFGKHGVDAKDGMEIGLISVEYLNSGETLIQYSGACMPIYIAKSNNSMLIEKINNDKKSIGFCEPDSVFQQHEFVLQKDSMIYLFTDGCFDQFGGEKDKKLKRKNFIAQLQKNVMDKTKNQQQSISNFLVNWQGNNEQLDDICLVGIRV